MMGSIELLAFDDFFFNEAAAGRIGGNRGHDAGLSGWLRAAAGAGSSVFFLPPRPKRRKPDGGSGST